MYIQAFHIDGFGLLHNVTVDALPPGLSIFLGQNEAGKSTCLDFFRTMLTGYPLRRTSRERDYSVVSGQAGGTLQLVTDEGLVQLTRRPGKGSGLVSLSTASGAVLDIAVLDRLMGKISREVYRSVYGFSLSELQSLESLSSDEVRSALYGTSFGMGLRSPAAALSSLSAAKEELFKARGSKPLISATLREWEELRQKISRAEKESAQYDDLASDLRSIEASLAALRVERAASTAQLSEATRRLGVWRQWEEWHLAGARLDRLEFVPVSFPLDGLARLEKILEQQEAAKALGSRLAEKLELARTSLQALHVDETLCAAGPDLHSLAERKSSYRNALAAIPRLESELERQRAELEAVLGSLGTQWNLERIHAVDRSLFVREELERQAGEMNIAATNHAALVASMNKATQELEEARHARELAQIRLDTLPVPVAELEEVERENLRRNLARAEEAASREPERQKALQQARAEYSRALAPLQLRPAQPSLESLDALSVRQEEATLLAQKVLEADAEYVQAQRQVEQGKTAEEQQRQRLVRMEEERSRSGMPTRGGIEVKRGQMRSLRALAAEQAVEQDRLAELNEGYNEHLAAKPVPPRHTERLVLGLVLLLAGLWFYLEWPLRLDLLGFSPEQRVPGWLGLPLLAGGALSLLLAISEELRGRMMSLCGLVLALAGGATVVARRISGLSELRFGSWALPLELWPGYLALFFGIVCLAWGMSRKKQELGPYELQTMDWQRRMDAQNSRLNTLSNQTTVLREQLGLASLFAEAFEELEARLDAELELCATNDRLQQDIARQSEELKDARAYTSKLEAEASQVRARTQNVRKRWHDYMQELGVQSVPLPEGAQAYFVRVEAARLAWSAFAAIEQEMADLRNQQLALIREAQRLLPPHAAPETWERSETVMEAVRRVLESCREADMLAEERARATEALRGCESIVKKAEQAQLEAASKAQDSEQGLQTARKGWQAILADLGLDLELSPATTREALEYMDRALALEVEEHRLRSELSAQLREREALARPLSTLLVRLGKEPLASAETENAPDWLRTLDSILAQLEEARLARDEALRIERTVRELEEEAHLARKSFEEAGERLAALLGMAEVSDAEAFRHKAAVLAEREQLARRRQDLEDALAMAAGKKELPLFLEEFTLLDRAELEEQTAHLATALEHSATEEESLSDQAGTLRARLGHLASSDTLAELRLQEAALAENLRVNAQQWSRQALAYHILSESKKRFEKERQPEVVRMASDLFAAISQGEWSGISTSLEDSSLKVLRPHGEAVGPEYLSRGTQEQLYLSLRIAGIRQNSAHGEPLPVIMDDILVNFDPGRAKRSASMLGELVAPSDGGQGHQLIYFTCHPHTAQRLQESMPAAKLFTIERGKIYLAE